MSTPPLVARSAWTHVFCDPCWYTYQLDRGVPLKQLKAPARMKDPKREICCGCALPTTSGIYYHEHPMLVSCLGEHRESASKVDAEGERI